VTSLAPVLELAKKYGGDADHEVVGALLTRPVSVGEAATV